MPTGEALRTWFNGLLIFLFVNVYCRSHKLCARLSSPWDDTPRLVAIFYSGDRQIDRINVTLSHVLLTTERRDQIDDTFDEQSSGCK